MEYIYYYVNNVTGKSQLMQAVFPKILQHSLKNLFFTKKKYAKAMQLVDIKSNNTTRWQKSRISQPYTARAGEQEIFFALYGL